eukprot:1528-Heterococcus_DN1.PRE.6
MTAECSACMLTDALNPTMYTYYAHICYATTQQYHYNGCAKASVDPQKRMKWRIVSQTVFRDNKKFECAIDLTGMYHCPGSNVPVEAGSWMLIVKQQQQQQQQCDPVLSQQSQAAPLRVTRARAVKLSIVQVGVMRAACSSSASERAAVH